MTPEQVFAQLRDIHLPETEAVASYATMDLRPLAAFVLIAAVAIAIQRWMAARRIKRALACIDPAAPPAEQRDAISRLVRTWPHGQRETDPPDAIFRPPAAIEPEDVDLMRTWAHRTCQ